MLTAGCDVGSLTGKAVIMEGDVIKAWSIIPRHPNPQKTAEAVMKKTLEQANLNIDDIDFVVGTGYGRLKIQFANADISEISCHGKGASWLLPTVRTVIDIGGQDCKVISVNEKGEVVDFVMNDKCAAGTGRFLELSARALGLELSELGEVSLQSKSPSNISAQCSVFAESEIVSLLAEDVELCDIAAGVNKSIATRVITLVKRVGGRPDLTVTGGVAKNRGVVEFLKAEFGEVKTFPVDPQLVGAIGAALIARAKLESQRKEAVNS